LADEGFKHVYFADILDYPNMFATRFDTRGSLAPYGYAPTVNILSTAEDLQKLKATFREGTEFSYKPPILGTSPEGEYEEDIELVAGKISWAKMGTQFTPVSTTFDPNGVLQEMAEAKNTIREAMMTEVIQGVGDAKYVTAEAIAVLQRQFVNKFSGTWAAIQNELIIPLTRACIFVLGEMNLINTDELTEFEIVAKNPITKNNEWAEIDKIIQDYQTTAQIIGAELALEKFDIPKLAKMISDVIGTNKDVLKKTSELGAAIEETKQLLRQMAGGAHDAGANEAAPI
jgi:hypothetical protein